MEVQIEYRPQPTQARFHQSRAKFKLYRGGLGSGKTLSGCHEALKECLENPGTLGLISRKTYQELEDTTMRTFFEQACPSELIKSFNKLNRHLYLYNGSEILFRSLDEPDKFKSLELGFFYIDEGSETTEETFWTLAGRLRKKDTRLSGFMTTNPVNVTHWIYKLFVTNKSDDFEEFHASTYENEANLPEGYIKTLEKNYPPAWVKKYLNGDWGFTEGGQPAFTLFREDLHVGNFRYMTEMPVHVGLDFGFRRPAAIFSQVDDKDRWIILSELMPENITVHDFAKMILEHQRKKYPLASNFYYYYDPAGNQVNDKNERTSVEILRDYNISGYSRKTSPAARVEIIQRRLQRYCGDRPSLLVDRSCSFLIDAFSGGYRYQEKRPEEIEKDGLYEHVVDALGYAAVNMFGVANAQLLRRDSSPRKLGNFFGIRR